MGQINRKRMESLVTLASDEMHNTMFEGLFLFDINQVDAPPMEVQERTKQFDEDGKPVMRLRTWRKRQQRQAQPPQRRILTDARKIEQPLRAARTDPEGSVRSER